MTDKRTPSKKPAAAKPWEDPALATERESHAMHRDRMKREAREGAESED